MNKATEAELDAVKGIGPATSKQIIAERKKSDFKNWEDLKLRVKGIGDARATRLSSQGLTVNGDAYKTMAGEAKVMKEDRKTTKHTPASSGKKSEPASGMDSGKK